jgi:hypothetical protein
MMLREPDSGRPAKALAWTRVHVVAILVLLAFPITAAGSSSAANTDFHDVSASSRFAQEIGWLAETGITMGCGDGTRYCPNDPVTRAQMAAFLARFLELPPSNITASFTDVPANHPFAGEIGRITEAGITTGCGDGTRYCPNDPVTRAQMAAFLARSLELPPSNITTSFTDVPANHPFADEIGRITEAGITTGCGDGTRYCPNDPVTRAQMAAFLARAANTSAGSNNSPEGDAHPPDGDASSPDGDASPPPLPPLAPDGVESEGWRLVWSDEFDGDSLDTSVWRPYHNTYGDGNKELQCNTPGNVTVGEGTLKITAERERVTCPNGSERDFTTGFLGTRENGVYFPRFARYEMRARIPHAQGLWPAFWLRHRDGAGVAEVDIMEYFHSQVPGRTSATLHLDGRLNLSKQTAFIEQPTLNPGWHTWAVEIDEAPNGVVFRFLVNDQVIHTYTDTQANWAERHPDQPLFDIAVNMAVGGNWVGHPDDPLGYLRNLDRCAKWNDPGPAPDNCNAEGIQRARFPMTYEIDYVRVYERT